MLYKKQGRTASASKPQAALLISGVAHGFGQGFLIRVMWAAGLARNHFRSHNLEKGRELPLKIEDKPFLRVSLFLSHKNKMIHFIF